MLMVGLSSFYSRPLLFNGGPESLHPLPVSELAMERNLTSEPSARVTAALALGPGLCACRPSWRVVTGGLPTLLAGALPSVLSSLLFAVRLLLP